MNNLEVAQLVLASIAQADGGCVPCIQECVDLAIGRHPELPWEDAIGEVEDGPRQDAMRECVGNARMMKTLEVS